MSTDVIYPPDERYTLQWLEPHDDFLSSIIPNNTDAAFKKRTRRKKPSELLLHYNYGAAAVKWWGQGAEVFQKHPGIPRPSAPVPAPMGPPKIARDRGTATQRRDRLQDAAAANITVRPSRTMHGSRKRDTARDTDRVGVGSAARAGAGEMVDSEGQARLDEDDVMLLFWGNSKAAKDRYCKKVEESTQRMMQWREQVSV
jgi:hypothetical protein